MQLIALQIHREDSGTIQLKMAADDDGQVLLPQQGLAELQQPHQQHVVSSTANKHCPTPHCKCGNCRRQHIVLLPLPYASVYSSMCCLLQLCAELDTDLGSLYACNLHSCLLSCVGLQ